MGVQCGGAGRMVLLLGQQLREFNLLLAELAGVYIKDLWQASPSHIAHKNTFLVPRRGPAFGLKLAQKPNGGEVVATFLLERAATEPIFSSDAVIILVAQRYGFGVSLGSSSAGSKIYRSLTISQAWSWACWGVSPCWISLRRIESISWSVFSSASRSISCRIPLNSSSATIFGRNWRQCFSAIRPYCVSGCIG